MILYCHNVTLTQSTTLRHLSLFPCHSNHLCAPCRRRLPSIMLNLRMAQNLKNAITFIEQGRILLYCSCLCPLYCHALSFLGCFTFIVSCFQAFLREKLHLSVSKGRISFCSSGPWHSLRCACWPRHRHRPCISGLKVGVHILFTTFL